MAKVKRQGKYKKRLSPVYVQKEVKPVVKKSKTKSKAAATVSGPPSNGPKPVEGK